MEKKIKKQEDNVIITNDVNRVIKIVCYLSTFFASIFAILVFVFGTITSYSVIRETPTNLIHDNFIMTFISKITNSTIEEAKLCILSTNSKFVYVTFNIIVPTIALVCASILIILLASLVLRFFDNASTEKKIFNNKKVKQLENIIDILCVILFISWAIFNQPAIPYILLIYLFLFITFYLFKKCVEYYNNK